MMYFADELYDGQLLRTVGHCTYGGAEIGECWAAAREVRPGDRESWYRAWTKLADRTSKAAEASRRAGRRVSALHAFLRASNYYRTAYVLHLEVPLPAVVREAYRKHGEAFGAAAALMRNPAERLAIPYECGVLPGYFVPAPEGGARPLVISVGGYDSTAEESYFFNAAAAGERGYHALVFDGPGQGELIIEHGIPFRPDWEKVLDAVLDAAVARPDVDARRIAVIGELRRLPRVARGAGSTRSCLHTGSGPDWSVPGGAPPAPAPVLDKRTASGRPDVDADAASVRARPRLPAPHEGMGAPPRHAHPWRCGAVGLRRGDRSLRTGGRTRTDPLPNLGLRRGE
jgi:hypothetical protein